MIKYKLLKDLPTFKVGDLFYISQCGDLVHDDGDVGVTAYTRQTLEKFPDILTEWFEEIQEELTDSIHWKPKNGEKIWYLDDNGDTNFTYFDEDDSYHLSRFEFGNIYRTSGECEQARERKLAEVRLRRTSNFKPDWNNDNQNKWTVYYDHNGKELLIEATTFLQYSSAIYFDTYDSVKKTIEENREDWLIYFGIEEEI